MREIQILIHQLCYIKPPINYLSSIYLYLSYDCLSLFDQVCSPSNSGISDLKLGRTSKARNFSLAAIFISAIANNLKQIS